MRSLRSFCAIVAALATALAAAGCASNHPAASSPHLTMSNAPGVTDLLSSVRKRGTLLISTDADYEPLSFRTPAGEWRGFDVDVGREVARRLGVRAEFLDTNFDVISGGSWSGRWDVNVDSMTITHDRQRVLYFTDPYYYVPAIFIVHRDNQDTSPNELTGKRIGVGTATTYQAYLEGHLTLANERILQPAPQGRAIPYNTDELALRDLALGDGVRLDAVLTAFPFAEYQIKLGRPFRILGTPVFYEDSAIAIDKNSPLDPKRFYQAVEKAVEDMHRDGTLTRLSMRDFGADLSRR